MKTFYVTVDVETIYCTELKAGSPEEASIKAQRQAYQDVKKCGAMYSSSEVYKVEELKDAIEREEDNE